MTPMRVAKATFRQRTQHVWDRHGLTIGLAIAFLVCLWPVLFLIGCAPVGPHYRGADAANTEYPHAAIGAGEGTDAITTPGGVVHITDADGRKVVVGGMTPTLFRARIPELGMDGEWLSGKNFEGLKFSKTTKTDGTTTYALEGMGTSASEATRASNEAFESLMPAMLQQLLSQQQDNADARKALADLAARLESLTKARTP